MCVKSWFGRSSGATLAFFGTFQLQRVILTGEKCYLCPAWSRVVFMDRIAAASVNESLAFGFEQPSSSACCNKVLFLLSLHTAVLAVPKSFLHCLGEQPKVGVQPPQPCCAFLLANSKRLCCGCVCWVCKAQGRVSFKPSQLSLLLSFLPGQAAGSPGGVNESFPACWPRLCQPFDTRAFGHVEVRVPLLGIPFGEEFQAFPHPKHPFKEMKFIVQ